MVPNDFDYLLAAARAVQEQALNNPDVGIPVDPDVADFMGALYDPALDDAGDADDAGEADAGDDSMADAALMQDILDQTEGGMA